MLLYEKNGFAFFFTIQEVFPSTGDFMFSMWAPASRSWAGIVSKERRNIRYQKQYHYKERLKIIR